MSVAGRLKAAAPGGTPRRAQWMRTNVVSWFARLGRPPRGNGATPAWRAPSRLIPGALIALALVAGTMVLIDAWAIAQARNCPQWLHTIFNELSDFGRSAWFLVPIGLSADRDRRAGVAGACRACRGWCLPPSRCGWVSCSRRSLSPVWS